MKSYASMLKSSGNGRVNWKEESPIHSRSRHLHCALPLDDRNKHSFAQKRNITSPSLLRERTPSVGKVNQAMAENLWKKVSRSQSKHFIYPCSRSVSMKKSQLSESIEKIDLAINKQKREHLLQNLSDFSSIKKSSFNRSKLEPDHVKVERRRSEQSVNSDYKSALHSIMHTRNLVSPGRSSVNSKYSLPREGSSNSILSNGRPNSSSKKTKPSVQFVQSIYGSKVNKNNFSSIKPFPNNDKVLVSPNDDSTKSKGKYALPDSFVYVAKSFKPMDTSKKPNQLLPTPKGPMAAKRDQVSETSESCDVSTEDMKYRFSRFTVPSEPQALESSSSRGLFLEIKQPSEVTENSEVQVKAQLVFQGINMNKKSEATLAKGISPAKPSLKPLTNYQVLLQKKGSQSFKPKSETSSKKSVSPREIRLEESESVRLINEEIERMIGVLKEKKNKKSKAAK